MKNRGFVVATFAALAGTLATLASSASFAQTFPTRPVRLVVPYVAGGSTDIIGRTMAQQLTEIWGQSVLVDNRGGGATIIGTDIVAKGTPDGHVLAVTTAAFGINPALFAGKLPYDSAKDFSHIMLINTSPFVLVVPTDLMAGRIDFVFNGTTSVLSLIQAGKLRALGASSLRRISALPDVPTMDESGLKGYSSVAWNGLSAPAKTPGWIISKTNADANKALAHADVQQRLKNDGSESGGGSVQDFEKFIRDENVRWTKVIKSANIKPE